MSSSFETIENEEVCSICICAFGNESVQRSNIKCKQCKKYFHFDCHIEYFRHRSFPHKLPCPNCRGELEYKDYDEIYKFDDKLYINTSKDIYIQNLIKK
jgi:hypothetical protein